MNERRAEAIADGVLAWLDAHPDAADTAEGIARWWLPSGENVSMSDLEQVLERLVARGLVERRPAVDGRVRYRRAVLPGEAP